MLEKLIQSLRTVHLLEHLGGQPTVGEVARWSRIPKSSVKRALERAYKFGLVDCTLVEYKTTGKRLFRVTEKGLDFLGLQPKESDKD